MPFNVKQAAVGVGLQYVRNMVLQVCFFCCCFNQTEQSIFIIYIYSTYIGKNICWNSLLLCFMVLAIIIVSLQWFLCFFAFQPRYN